LVTAADATASVQPERRGPSRPARQQHLVRTPRHLCGGTVRHPSEGHPMASKRPRKRSTRKSAAKTAVEQQTVRGSEWELSDEQVEIALQTGEQAGLLEDYFGREEYDELRQLAREAAARGVRGGPRVLILPGIMGSKLGRPRAGWFDDVVWIDPVDIIAGNLRQLALPPRIATNRAIRPLGVILFSYLKLKLRLRSAGYDADFFPFDWRISIDELGVQLRQRIAEDDPDGHGRVSIVAHSMGGLVA